VIDAIIGETLRLEKEKGIFYFLMDYARDSAFVAKPARSLFEDGEIALMMGARRLVAEDERYRAPILYNFGRWAPFPPPCVDPNGNFVSSLFYPPQKPQDRPQYGCTYVGTFDARTGHLLPPPYVIGISGWDEHFALTLAGRTVFRNHWSNIGAREMDGRGAWSLDMPGHYLSGSRKEGGYPGWMGGAMQNGSNGVSIAGGRVYCFSASHLAAAKARVKGEN
jgi:hypothetical protein